ncbi:MAG: amidase [Burkholderiaceae bacterium]
MKSALTLASDFASGALSPVESLAQTRAQLASVDPELHIMIATRDHTTLDEEARASEQRWRAGKPLSALDGVPIAVKDNILTHDLPTSWGNAFLAKQAGTVDEIAVDRLRRAGLLIIGKTSVPEFTLEGYTANSLAGVTGNPWNSSLTPGGSSGGSVAGVASGCFPLALGTDGGGSIRRPAGYTGLIGLKPSIGRVARNHTLPPLLLDFEVIGPIGRRVADVSALLDIIAGPDLTDRTSRALPDKPLAGANNQTAQPRVLIVSKLGESPVDAAIDQNLQGLASKCDSLGWQLSHESLPVSIDEINAVWPDIGGLGLVELARTMPEAIDAAAAKYQSWVDDARQLPAHRLLEILEITRVLRRDVDELFEAFDFLLMPTSAAMPWAADQTHPTSIAGEPVGPRGHAVFTGWINAAGLPAVTLPGKPSSDGLPIGYQLVGPWGADQSLLAAAGLVEPLLSWAGQLPPAYQSNR